MSEGTRDHFESPIEDVLSDLPQEDPPADLRDRCVDAVKAAGEEASERAPQPLWPVIWKGSLALAACFVLMIGAMSAMMGKSARPRLTASRPDFMQSEAASEPMPATEEAEGWDFADDKEADAEYAPAAPAEAAKMARSGGIGPAAAPGAAPGAPGPAATDAAQAAPAGAMAGATLRQADEAPRAMREIGTRAAADNREQVADRLEAGDEAEMAPAEGAAGAAGPVHDLPVVDPVSRPWRDQSGDRQKVERADMEIEVDDVEQAFDRAENIIEKEEGHIDNHELQVNEKRESIAFISARVPVENLRGTVAQLRELGEVISLVGESEDRTKEYDRRGGQIRGIGATEVELVEKYEKETDARKKAALKREIDALRAQNNAAKAQHQELSDLTHFAMLNLTISEAAGPKQFLVKITETVPRAAAWVAVSAIFWLPALVFGVVIWRRLHRR